MSSRHSCAQRNYRGNRPTHFTNWKEVASMFIIISMIIRPVGHHKFGHLTCELTDTRHTSPGRVLRPTTQLLRKRVPIESNGTWKSLWRVRQPVTWIGANSISRSNEVADCSWRSNWSKTWTGRPLSSGLGELWNRILKIKLTISKKIASMTKQFDLKKRESRDCWFRQCGWFSIFTPGIKADDDSIGNP